MEGIETRAGESGFPVGSAVSFFADDDLAVEDVSSVESSSDSGDGDLGGGPGDAARCVPSLVTMLSSELAGLPVNGLFMTTVSRE
jgi:hypothetical protein